MDLNFIELLKIIFLGIVEGITEWLPVSSTGHMLLVDAFIHTNMTQAFKDMFFVVIQLGAIIAVIVEFWSQMNPFVNVEGKGVRIKRSVFNMWVKVVVAFLPSAVFGLFLNDFLEEHFGTPLTIAIMLIVYGIAFIVIERWNKTRVPKINTMKEITYQAALIIGMFQVLSMIPGTSRSGATIVGALLIGVSRVVAAEFTFFLAVPTMLGASAFKLLKFGLHFSLSEVIALIVGMVVAYVVSIFVIKFLMSYIKRRDFQIFGWYRIALGIIVILFIIVGVI
ncbi:undecaprenyl-diphosphate phosphatase [Lactococcus formosensis]|jgi:undecaprenyl-diphosphatase|uniref:Undecaprenyl-diphosphatase n=1 Tax=Lactococcus formosensis TaxID=1281486 RepID=A0A9X4NZH5_9LACT|nr:undecaprenyl-diphosphate phosphatase [Lactococcus formosensis]NHI67979.1 undecaprenyl-diphosphate phosphatase [Lactococcus garvieae]MCH1723450.1 undecaprenyl-diphosphate phosphatase [Lactococcus formosensis]MCO7181221.1 undecaprenyl-diphosphate phosphatase [Lactococcus formosensis]MDG6112421.1 undecaprenyl-diphosphate phosphatase [Lactococcus formosensis]MDG6113431.1 undecaprenyl-diphosphate phosphatase [Lactococcus formosensis]